MRARWLGVLSLVAIAFALPAFAITNGHLDGTAHPYVGLVVVFDADGHPLWRGSGTLMSPTVFLTAGHVCAADGEDVPASARVYFEPDVDAANAGGAYAPLGYPFGGGHTGTPIPHPDYAWVQPNTHDVGVVLLDAPVVTSAYGALPSLRALDALAKKRGKQSTSFDVVGYGLQYIRDNPIKGPVKIQAERARYAATVTLVNLTNALTDGYTLQHTGDAGKGNGPGGTNFGDSGGPLLLPGTNVVIGLTSWGFNANATGVGFAWRTDIAETQDFLAGFGL
jgi:hypothetical protein